MESSTTAACRASKIRADLVATRLRSMSDAHPHGDRQRPSLQEATDALTDTEREQIAQRWLQAAGKPQTDDAVQQLAQAALATIPRSPLDRMAVEFVRQGKPVDPRELTAALKVEQSRRAKALEVAAPKVAAFVEQTWAKTGQGPLWSDVSRYMGWTHREGQWAIKRLHRDGVLTSTDQPHSLRVANGG